MLDVVLLHGLHRLGCRLLLLLALGDKCLELLLQVQLVVVLMLTLSRVELDLRNVLRFEEFVQVR